ncbi:hypothetical protein [Streptococcus sp. CSL10205-OR2]|uniref:hypothetical protein n=1 Tax=Streptococcus sp. CSL10205-OR2 TaxID=2980558 RepID=UPI0021DAF65D|nr:hypothetical protein [Streptococcus sp. CSL10205-OR2]MCU9533971.1 hypothetical protein [Streptococcus sp. CSL10205-OR2]
MKKLDTILNYCSDERHYHQGSYYRLKSHGDNIYSLTISVPGFCGENTPHPMLKFSYDGTKVDFISYVDYETNPIKTLFFDEENELFFQKEFKRLIDDFYAFYSEKTNKKTEL